MSNMDQFLYFRWDFESESGRLSPWDLELIDEYRRPTEVGAGVKILPDEIGRKLYRFRHEDWGGDRFSECDRISAELSTLMKLKTAIPFASTVDPTSTVEYPMDLSTIKKRLDNRFYRRKEAVIFDVRHIFTNAEKFAKRDVVRSASVITNLCLDFIGNRNAVDEPFASRSSQQSQPANPSVPATNSGSQIANGVEASSKETIEIVGSPTNKGKMVINQILSV